VSAVDPIYLDYAATTPVDPLVAQAMIECLGEAGDFANPASATHVPGRRAHARIERARAQVAALIGAEAAQIIFTSGATESNNLAILGVARANADRGRHIVSSRIEHRAVLDPCRRLEKEGFAVTYLLPDRAGRITPEAVAAALRADTVLVSLMQVNNEIGVVQDIAAIAAICRAREIPLHTDAAQSVGKMEVDARALGVDFLSLTAHKIYGQGGGCALCAPGESTAPRARLLRWRPGAWIAAGNARDTPDRRLWRGRAIGAGAPVPVFPAPEPARSALEGPFTARRGAPERRRGPTDPGHPVLVV
jgi:cysteine sulfinate desulfinase/cysteine desulfurase-like protein